MCRHLDLMTRVIRKSVGYVLIGPSDVCKISKEPKGVTTFN